MDPILSQPVSPQSRASTPPRSRRNSIEADTKRKYAIFPSTEKGGLQLPPAEANPLFAVDRLTTPPIRERTFWMPDNVCRECGEAFNLFKRRHHCRLCGLIYCHACSPHSIEGTEHGYHKQFIRICKRCFKTLDPSTGVEMSSHEMDPASPTSPLMPMSHTVFDYDTHNGDVLSAFVSDAIGDDAVGLSSVPTAPPTAAPAAFRRRPSMELRGALEILQRQDTPLVPMPSIGECATSTLLEQHQEVAASQLQALLVARLEAIALPAADRQVLLDNISVHLSSTTKRFVEMPYFRTHLGFNHQDLIAVKTIASAETYGCSLVQGVVCHKNVSHKKAAKVLEAPRVLLLRDGIVFGHATERLSSLDTLLDQEKTYMKQIVDKITRLQPHIIFAGQSVSRLAQDLLAESNIALVLNVKPELLERIARHTKATVVPSTEALSPEDWHVLGRGCATFHVETYLVQEPEKQSKKRESFIYLEGSEAEAGGTIVLQGPDKAVLRQLKALWRDVAAMAYDLSLQAYVLTDLMYPVVPVSKSPTLHAVKGMVKLVDVPNRPKFAPCSSPTPFTLDYYSALDKALGAYLFQDCIAPSTKCQVATCRVALIDHIQTYSCGDGTVLVAVENLPEKERLRISSTAVVDEARPDIYFWRYCRLCERVVTPFVVLSSMALQFSFGRFLEIILSIGGPILAPDCACPHDGQTAHLLYFNCGPHAVRVEYVEERPWFVQHDNCLPFDRQWYLGLQKSLGQDLLEAVSDVVVMVLNELHDLPPSRGAVCLELLVEATKKELLGQLQQIVAVGEVAAPDAAADVNGLRRAFFHTATGWLRSLQSLQHAEEAPALRINTADTAGTAPSSAAPSPTTGSPTALEVPAKSDADAIVEELDPPLPLTLPPASTWKSTLGSILLGSNSNSPRTSVHAMELPELLATGSPQLPPGAHGRVVAVHDDVHFSYAAYALNSTEYETELAALKLHELQDVSTEGLLRSKVDSSLRLKFALSADAELVCVVHYAIQFEALRSLFYGRHADFISSIASCATWNTQGGKSGAKFFRTLDDRFVIKYVSQTELQCFLTSAVAYCEHIAKVYFEGMSSVLSKLVGVYSVTHTGKKWTEHIVVMENIFCNVTVGPTYDLKGTTRNRYAPVSSPVLLDGNLLVQTLGLPSPLHPRSYEKLLDAIKHDVAFLSDNNIIDYSLVIGYCPEEALPVDDANENGHLKTTNRVLLVGIIDYLRHFDFIKRMESVGKSVTMIAGQEAPTIVQPKQYATRFLNALTLQYFMPVPPMQHV
ncbi:phosphatidylinositol-3-phosphate 5-kinase [Achlya hypogyna]|uniref:1-phosphatidylinositol-3-phosphate 5-kinase n=1 Tax=Achlya hypogyna TaxID=1202772 RepID=A0A1V9Z741_ACHHY|nr:phosphatidylinositol-3-phosphate 5-kinase [Achlya hypogyna]